MKEAIKRVGITLGLSAGAAVLGYLLLVMVFMIRIPEEKYSETAQILAEEGYHQRDSLRNGKSDYYHEIYPDILDIGTDEYIVRYSLKNASDSAAYHALVDEEAVFWARYWHGYAIVLRPLFKLFDLSEVRMINAGAQLFLFLILALLVYKATRKMRYSLAICSLYFLLVPSATGVNFQYSSIYYAAVISSIVLLKWKDFFFKNNRYFYLFVLTGAFTSYIDFLTYPLFAWGLPAALLVVLIPYSEKADTPAKERREGLVHLIRSAIAWIIGYMVFWFEKWVLATAFSDHNVLESAFNEMLFRTGTSESFSVLKRLEIAALNFSHLTAKPFVVLFLCWVLYWMFCFVRKGYVTNSKMPALGLMLLSGTAWFFMAANHTGGHHLFAWKNSLSTVAAMLMIICVSTGYKESVVNRRAVLGRLFVAAVCVALALGTYVALPIEEFTANNYSASGADVSVKLLEGEERAYEMSFVPRYSLVKNVAPLLKCDDKEGYIGLSVINRDGKVIDSVKVHAGEEAVVSVDVGWRLKAGEEYVLRISTEEVSSPVTVWIDNEKTLQENAANDVPIAISYTYHAPFTDKASTLFYLMEWFCLYMTLVFIYLMGAMDKIKAAKIYEQQSSGQN